ncbi:MAG: class I SAM-dependent methyltransferase [Chloroflexi bacterium]|nr:class I SAM-dependent methyltransferase [Chloroflexota bacterium]
MANLILKPGREKSVLHRHPWIFSSAVLRMEGDPEEGETLCVMDSHNKALGWAAFSPHSQIRARMWSWNPDESIDQEFLKRRLATAIALRRAVIPAQETDALRLVHAESDGLPGIIVDRYADTLVLQLLTAGAERWREDLANLLIELTGLAQIYERSDVDVRRLEGLPERVGPLRGEIPHERVMVQENDLKFWVDVIRGHKTGFYLDQRPNRQRLRLLAYGRTVLNCFSYTGAFAAFALAGGASSVLSVDSSTEALKLGIENVAVNGFPAERAEWMEGDVFQVLRSFRDERRSFDLIILDPPKFAPTIAQAEKAARGYKDINLLAFKLLRPGGLLFTFSCSGGISMELFQKIVAGAALDAGVEARIVERLGQGPDHPVALNFPEGQYLKGLICAI